MTERLSLATLARVRPGVAKPSYNPAALQAGIVHLGVGAFHRAHQCVFTEDAILQRGGDWGIIGVSLRRPDVPRALKPQDCLYTVETLDREPRYRIMGVLRDALTATEEKRQVLAALTAKTTSIVTLTITEKGYALDPSRASVVGQPWTAMDWLVASFALRLADRLDPITVISCDNLQNNGDRLRTGVLTIAQQRDPALANWITSHVTFPNTMIDSIVPATNAAAAERVADAVGLIDSASVQREPFAQWVIEDRFAGPRPAWDQVGVDIVTDVRPFERLKLHVLNATHSALAYLGIPRGYAYVREAIADPELLRTVEQMVATEITPALLPLDVASYWRTVRSRFENPMVNHALEQIAQDGSAKLAQRIFPLLIANARAGLPTRGLAAVINAWLAFAKERERIIDPQAHALADWRSAGGLIGSALDRAELFPDAFRHENTVRHALGAT